MLAVSITPVTPMGFVINDRVSCGWEGPVGISDNLPLGSAWKYYSYGRPYMRIHTGRKA